jgi:ABC-type lipoprotein export system ATPase subunit
VRVAVEDEFGISESKKKNLDITWIPQSINLLANNNTEQNITLQCQPQCPV